MTMNDDHDNDDDHFGDGGDPGDSDSRSVASTSFSVV